MTDENPLEDIGREKTVGVKSLTRHILADKNSGIGKDAAADDNQRFVHDASVSIQSL